MKTKLLLFAILTTLVTGCSTAQDRTTIYAKNGEISDNLDLKAVASVFGESSNLQDFERRLNDPRLQLSNLDLNYDNQVDYLRVIESVENRTHVIVIQAVLGRDMFQDVATIDVEKDRYNNVSIQVVGDIFMYGPNYIYEPVYYRTPAIYASFWIGNYRPYYSRWNWNYYPTYYYTWNPFPVYRYRSNINHCINVHNSYRYVSYRSNYRASQICASTRNNAFERRYPDYSFSRRNNDVVNRYELDRRRDNREVYSDNRNVTRYQANTDRNYSASRVEPSRRYADNNNYSRENTIQRRDENTTRIATPVREEPTRNYTENAGYNRRESTTRTEVENNSNNRRSSSSREYSTQRTEQRTAAPSENRRSETNRSNTRNESQSSDGRENRGGNRRT
ncbi:hypothetical protein [Flavobacterium polysaccharolyticum]|uniref:Lipoprotein n=1 Tax=Flavobacterium polysaccharolyticum TaxID=3133148 RepID=A0ABU9NK92_9FLAO